MARKEGNSGVFYVDLCERFKSVEEATLNGITRWITKYHTLMFHSSSRIATFRVVLPFVTVDTYPAYILMHGNLFSLIADAESHGSLLHA